MTFKTKIFKLFGVAAIAVIKKMRSGTTKISVLIRVAAFAVVEAVLAGTI